MESKPKKRVLLNFACFNCRKTFKRPIVEGEWTRICPTCKGTEMLMGKKWRSPKKEDKVQWQIIELFIRSGHGFKFWDDKLKSIPFPKTLLKAREVFDYLSEKKEAREIGSRTAKLRGNKEIRSVERKIKKSERKNSNPKMVIKNKLGSRITKGPT